MVIEACGDVLVEITCAALFLEQIGIFATSPLASGDQRAIKQGFGDAVRAPVAAGHKPHGPVGIAGQTSLEERCVKTGHRGGNPRVHGVRGSEG